MSGARSDLFLLFGFVFLAAESSDAVRCRLRGLRVERLPWTDASGENMSHK